MEFSPKHRSASGRGKCCVTYCKSTKNKNLNLSFHKVPKYGRGQVVRRNLFGDVELVDKRSEWLKKLNVKDVNRELLVCSLHFTEKDFNFPESHAKLRILKQNAVPIVVNNNMSKEKQFINVSRQRRRDQRLFQKKTQEQENATNMVNTEGVFEATTELDHEAAKDKPESMTMANDDNEIEPEHHDEHCEQRNSAILDEEVTDDVLNKGNEFVDGFENVITTGEKAVQVTSGDFVISFCSFIKTENDLSIMCNIKSFKILNELTDIMNETYPPKRRRLISTRDSIILVTAKLKLDIPFNALGVLFNYVCDVTIRNIFYDTVKKLSTILQSVLTRVPKEEIDRNMPKCFDKFRSTTSVLDCTEVKVQKPKCLKCRIKFYSHYKSDLTVKFMTEVTPAGILVHISKSFGGRASDKCIFNHSGILHNLESTRDAVMVDKGFLIDDECMQKRIQLIRPPFVKGRQLSENDAIRNREIASARVHIERMNERIKEFQILNNRIPWFFLNYIDDIFIICCGFANLGTPILADDKF